MNIKETHEVAVSRHLLDVLRISYSNIRAGKAGIEPDCVITTQTGSIGVEITTAYYSPSAAKAEWQATRDLEKGKTGIYFTGGINEPDLSMATEILNRIQSKAGKRYSGVDTLMLLVHLQAQLTDDDFIDQIIGSLRTAMGEVVQFAAIYLGTFRSEGVYKVWPIFPKPTI